MNLTLNELISETEKCKRLAVLYFTKFINKKYNFEFNSDCVNYNDFCERFCLFYVGSKNYVKVYYNYKSGKMFARLVFSSKESYTLYNDIDDNQFKNIGNEELREYKNVIEFFTKPENIKEICSYAIRISKFLYDTTYIVSLPKAYTFLLCNKKNKIFPRDISKLIAYKILFFLLLTKLKK